MKGKKERKGNVEKTKRRRREKKKGAGEWN